jgi:hypothetical protein
MALVIENMGTHARKELKFWAFLLTRIIVVIASIFFFTPNSLDSQVADGLGERAFSNPI